MLHRLSAALPSFSSDSGWGVPAALRLREARQQHGSSLDVVQETCSDFPAELVELYLGDSCKNLLCDGSQKAPSERPLYIQATLAFCPAKNAAAATLCAKTSQSSCKHFMT